MTKPKLAVIGANEFQEPLIRKGQEMGFEVHAFAWATGDVGERSADVFHPVSIVEKETILNICRQVGVTAACSIGSDLAVHTVNYIQRALGKPANPPETDRIATNKYEMRRAFLAAGVPCPKFLRVSAPPSPEALAGMTWPLIVKPTDRSGSRGIYQCADYGQVRAAVGPSCEQSFEKCAIVEEYITGTEYSCESISYEGRHRVLALTKKYTTGSPHFIETGHTEPSDIPAALQPAVKAHVTAALDALHIRYGASHAEFMLDGDGGFHIIEIGARMGGDCIGSDLVYLSTGMDFMAMVVDAACGKAPDLTVRRAPRRADIRFLFGPGDVAALAALKKTAPESIWRAAEDADLSAAVTDSSNRHGYYITLGELL